MFVDKLNPFSVTNRTLGLIKTNSTVPIREKSELTSYQNDQLKQKIDDLLESDYLKRSRSQWSSCVYPVYVNGEIDICVDYDHLNKMTKKIDWNVPSMNQIIESIQSSSNYFSLICIKDGFHQIELDAFSSHKTAFATGKFIIENSRLF